VVDSSRGTGFAVVRRVALPRRIVAGLRYLLTRRCAQRGFRLRPSDLTTQIFAYALALAMAKTGVQVHAICVMSNHLHIVITDVEGRLPEFMRDLNRSTAKALNVSQGQSENLWAAEPYDAVVLPTEEELLAQVSYVAANPVEAGLVESPGAWPGFIQWMAAQGTVAKPQVYFGERAPDFATWRVTVPSGMRWSDEEWRTRLKSRVRSLVDRARQRLAREGRRFLGREAVLAQPITKRATSYEKKRGIVPQFAARTWAVRTLMVRTLRHFRSAYRAALDAWRSGVRDVVFPHGTWWMRVHHRAHVKPPLAA
jgi:putative transposase